MSDEHVMEALRVSIRNRVTNERVLRDALALIEERDKRIAALLGTIRGIEKAAEWQEKVNAVNSLPFASPIIKADP